MEKKQLNWTLDLLASSSGVTPCLKLLCLLDKNMQEMMQVENVRCTLSPAAAEDVDKMNVFVDFTEPRGTKGLFSKMPDASIHYAVKITAPSGKVVNLSNYCVHALH